MPVTYPEGVNVDDDLLSEDLVDETLDDAEIETGQENASEIDAETSEQDGGQGHEEGEARGVAQPGKPRASDTIRELRRKNQDFERRLNELAAARSAPQQHPTDPFAAQRAAQLEQEQLALMEPEQRFNYQLQRIQQQNQAAMQALEFRMHDTADRAEFNSLKSSNPLAAKYEADVERLVSSERAAGRNVSRQVALKYVIGEKMLEKGASATTTQRKAAGARVASQQTRPANQSGAPREARGRGDDMAALERRLQNIPV